VPGCTALSDTRSPAEFEEARKIKKVA
jgi:hypothetical protein